MTNENSNAVSEISTLVSGEVLERAQPHTRDPDFSQVSAPARPKGLAERCQERKRRRRRNLRTLDGVIRAHVALLADMESGRVTLSQGEVYGRWFSRHREMVAAAEELRSLRGIQEQLSRINNTQPTALTITPVPPDEVSE